MKLTATTSSLLLASMALSPSLASAAPTGLEAPTSPNPAAVSPNIAQSSRSPHVPSSPSPNRSPAFRTGTGSPRRSIRHMHKSNKRDDPIGGLINSIEGPLSPILNPVTGLLDHLPLVGPELQKITVGLGLQNANVAGQAAGSSENTLAEAGSQSGAASNTNILGSNPLDSLRDPMSLYNGISGSLVGSSEFPDPIHGIFGSLPVVGSLHQAFPGYTSSPGRQIAQLPYRGLKIIGRTSGGSIIVEDANGVLREIPSEALGIPGLGEVGESIVSADSAPAASKSPPAAKPSSPSPAESPHSGASPQAHDATTQTTTSAQTSGTGVSSTPSTH